MINLNKKIIIAVLFLLILFPLFGFAQTSIPCDQNSATQPQLCNPITGADDLKSFIIKGIVIFAGFTTLIPIISIVFAGFLMILAQGNPQSIEKAKTAFSWSVYGFILAVCSYFVVAATIQFLGASNIPDPNTPGNTSIVNPLANLGTDVSQEFLVFIKNMLTGFLQIVGVLAILMLIFDGLRYITAGGNEEQSKQAKEELKWISAGIVSILFAYVIIRATASLLGLP